MEQPMNETPAAAEQVATRVEDVELTPDKPKTLRQRLGNLFGRNRGAIEVATARREASLLQIKKGYNEVVDTLQAVRSHMDEQSQRADKMLQVMQGLPELLKSMPETAANQTKILEGIQTNLESQRVTTDKLSSALATATESQKQVSTHLKQQLSAQNESSREMRTALNGLNTTMGDVTRANEATRQAYLEGAEQTREMFKRTHRQMTAMTVVSWVVAVIALGAAAYVAFAVSQMNPAPPPTPPSQQASAANPGE